MNTNGAAEGVNHILTWIGTDRYVNLNGKQVGVWDFCEGDCAILQSRETTGNHGEKITRHNLNSQNIIGTFEVQNGWLIVVCNFLGALTLSRWEEYL